jgi:sugar lactone lactonase YvrE
MAAAQTEIVDFDSDRWVKTNAETFEHMGRKSLSGFAYLEDVEFENGTIEVDMAVDGSRSYPGLIFRMQSMQNYERFYIRPHRTTGLYEDALQYVPVINGIAGWQLYSGEGFTAAAKVPYDEWVHLKMEILGTQARVYLGDAEEPALVITDLKHGKSKGFIGILGEGGRPAACFSNFRYTLDDNLVFDDPTEKETPFGIVTEWELSQTFKFSKIDIEKTPDAQGFDDIDWQKVKSEPSGLVDIARYHGRVPGESDWIWARTALHSEEDEVRRFLFGYSDMVQVFLNGKLLFTGNSAYRSRSPSFTGIVGLNDALHLPLRKGENELMLLVGETFGGWGFMCRDGSACFQHDDLTKLWELPQGFNYPESAVYDEKRDRLYVSNYFSGGVEFISKVKLSGEIENLKWISGLSRPTGLCIMGDTLFAIDRGGLVEIDIESGSVLQRHEIPGARFPNDVAADRKGNLYVSDGERDVIFKRNENAFEVWLESEEIKDPNGLYVDQGRLLVGTSSDGCLKSVDLDTREIRTITSLGKGSIMDGVKADGKGNYIISDYSGRVFRVTPEGKKTKLLDTTAQSVNSADLEYIAGENLLIIPTLMSNRLVAYKLNEGS